MTHIITSLCIRDRGCIDVCPVECMVPGPVNEWPWIYIDPDTCIDCGACVPECPYAAIFPNPKEFVTFAFGGAAPVHASSYGRPAVTQKAVILNMAPTFSAFGIVVSDTIHKKSVSLVMPERVDALPINETFAMFEKRAKDEVKEEGLNIVDLEVS